MPRVNSYFEAYKTKTLCTKFIAHPVSSDSGGGNGGNCGDGSGEGVMMVMVMVG